jgi:8-amino-7-oxononanoate synthase
VTGWSERVAGRLDSIRDAGRWRELRPLGGRLPEVTLEGRKVVSFAANDYLGLAGHPAVVEAAHAALDEWGLGAGASRLVVGQRGYHEELEAELASWKRTEAALSLPTGFAANVGVLAALADSPDVLIVSDELNHASIVDGCRLARGTVAVARHADPGHVDELLAAHDGPGLVVTDSVFSMDGDEAPIADLLDVCSRRGACLVLDEAHAVLGPAVDLDAAGALGVEVVRVGTMSKALGSVGGFVAASRGVVDLMVNVARPFIFTTGTTSADVAGALAALRIVRGAEGTALRVQLRAHIDAVAYQHPSPIVPVILGEERTALRAAAELLRHGLLVPAIRPPTVAPGTSRLRVALSAAHTEAQVERLVRALGPIRAAAARAAARSGGA